MPALSQHLPLSYAEMELLDCKLAVVNAIKQEQRKRKLTGAKLASRIGFTKARTAALLECGSDVTLDEIALAFFGLEKTRQDLAAASQAEVAMAWGVDSAQGKSPRRRIDRRDNGAGNASAAVARRAA